MAKRSIKDLNKQYAQKYSDHVAKKIAADTDVEKLKNTDIEVLKIVAPVIAADKDLAEQLKETVEANDELKEMLGNIEILANLFKEAEDAEKAKEARFAAEEKAVDNERIRIGDERVRIEAEKQEMIDILRGDENDLGRDKSEAENTILINKTNEYGEIAMEKIYACIELLKDKKEVISQAEQDCVKKLQAEGVGSFAAAETTQFNQIKELQKQLQGYDKKPEALETDLEEKAKKLLELEEQSEVLKGLFASECGDKAKCVADEMQKKQQEINKIKTEISNIEREKSNLAGPIKNAGDNLAYYETQYNNAFSGWSRAGNDLSNVQNYAYRGNGENCYVHRITAWQLNESCVQNYRNIFKNKERDKDQASDRKLKADRELNKLHDKENKLDQEINTKTKNIGEKIAIQEELLSWQEASGDREQLKEIKGNMSRVDEMITNYEEMLAYKEDLGELQVLKAVIEQPQFHLEL